MKNNLTEHKLEHMQRSECHKRFNEIIIKLIDTLMTWKKLNKTNELTAVEEIWVGEEGKLLIRPPLVIPHVFASYFCRDFRCDKWNIREWSCTPHTLRTNLLCFICFPITRSLDEILFANTRSETKNKPNCEFVGPVIPSVVMEMKPYHLQSLLQ